MSHSTIVESSLNESHSKIVEDMYKTNYDNEADFRQITQSSLESHGIFHKYPPGILNPSFTGMILWEIQQDHIFNNYKVCPYHMIKCGVILYGQEAFVFTPISNNDIKSFLKILFRGKILPNGESSTSVTKSLTDYIQRQSKQHIIPCIQTLRNMLHEMFKITEETFKEDHYSYLLLLKRIYIIIYMLRYDMPLQRKGSPGKRNMASSVNCFVGKGWYSYLNKREQKLLHRKDVIVSSSFIPDDILNGVCRSEITNFGNVQENDIKNSCMFRDGISNSTKFQQELHKYEYM